MMTSLNSRISSTNSSLSRPATEGTSVSLSGGAHNFRATASGVRPGGPNPPVVHIASHTEVFADDRYNPERDGKIGVSATLVVNVRSRPSLTAVLSQQAYDDMEMMDRKPRNDIHLQSFSPA